MPWARPSARATAWPGPRCTGRWAPPGIGSPSCIGCGARRPRRRRCTARGAAGAAIPIRGWRCSGWRRARWTWRRAPSAAWWRRRPIRAAAPPTSRPARRSCSPRATRARPAPPRTSSRASPRRAALRSSWRWRHRPRARSCWRRRIPQAALATLREAGRLWSELEAPYEAAQVRVLIGLAHRALGDEDTAAIELDAARHAFDGLGAASERRRVEALLGPAGREALAPAHGARGRGPPARGHRPDQPGHRRAAGDQREDGRPARQQHLHQAGVVHQGRGDGLRLAARAAGGVYIE